MPKKNSPGCTCCGGSGDPTVTIPGCSCTAVPVTLTMTVTGVCDPGVFASCTIVWDTTPSGYTTCPVIGTSCFLSTDEFVDTLSGLTYRWNLYCDTIFFRLARVYKDVGSGCFRDSSLYTWSIGTGGSTCSPFALTGGFIYPGGPATCHVEIH